MASSEEYKNYIVEQLSLLGLIQTRAMMGEYLLYYRDIYFGGIFDDRFLVKIVPQNKKYEMKEELPYKGAKNMYLVSDIENQERLKEIVLDTYQGLMKK